MASISGHGLDRRRLIRALVALAGLVASALVVLALFSGLLVRQGQVHKAELRAAYNNLPVYGAATHTRTAENWENLYTYWQSEGVLPRVVSDFHAEDTVGLVVEFYRQRLSAAGWQQYHEPWSLYPAYRKGNLRLAILFQHAYAQDWLPAGDYQVHLWRLPVLEELLGRDLGADDGG